MNYDKQKIETGPNTETQRAETAANKFFDMADKTNPHMESERQKREMFSTVGTETAQGNYDKAQRNLEVGAQWDDNLRGAASEVNQLNQERTGAKPMTLEDVQKTIGGYARDFEKMSKEKGGKQSDLEDAMALDNIVGDISEPGIEGIDNALEYLEGTLKSKNNTADSILKSVSLPPEDKAAFLKDWQDKRASRDALFQEKQKRVEQMKQSQRGTEELTKGRGATATRLEQAFTQAGIPEDAASRKEFLGRAGAMSAEELNSLDSALNKAAREAMRSGDPKMLEGLLIDLSTKSFKLKDVTQRQKAEDTRKIEEIRRSMGLPEQQPTKTDGRTEEEKEKVVEPRPPIKEAPKQEGGMKNPFEKLFSSKEVTSALDVPSDYYTGEKGVAAMVEAFKGQYSNPKQFATRVETLLGKFRSAVEDAKRSKPTASEEAHRNMANKDVIKGLSPSERQAIDKFLDANYQKMGGKYQRMISTEMPFGDFISFLERLKK